MSKKVVKKAKSKKTKKAEPKDAKPGKLVEIEAKLPLTDAAARERGNIACQKLEERDKLILERKKVADEYAARISALQSEAKKLLLEFREARELRTVKAREIRNFEKGQVEYHYKGEIIHSRTMTLADRQDDLPLKESKNAPLPKVSVLTDSADLRPTELKPAGATVTTLKRGPKYDPVAEAHALGEATQRADVAAVIQEETSARGKWNSIDGVK
ncbi:MAG: hypothetical protein ACXWPM_06780 [Bdellovibrionota bacterium]